MVSITIIAYSYIVIAGAIPVLTDLVSLTGCGISLFEDCGTWKVPPHLKVYLPLRRFHSKCQVSNLGPPGPF